MSSVKKIIAVIGATGVQGGSVVKALLADPKLSSEWAIRGTTRDASKDSSKKLASQGVEVATVSITKSAIHFFERKTDKRDREISTPRTACSQLSRARMLFSQ
jgi:alpha/beta superfamily hydrolase